MRPKTQLPVSPCAPSRATLARLAPLLTAALLLTAEASAQARMTYSLDYHGPLIGTLAPGSTDFVTEADLLDATPLLLGGNGGVKIEVSGGDLGLLNYASCVGHLGGDPCGIDVDAFSTGQDAIIKSNPQETNWRVFFTVDEYAQGNPQTPLDPSVRSEAAVADVSGDVWCTIFLPPPPLAPNTGSTWARVQALCVDGNGEPSPTGALAPGHALKEPNIPGQGLPFASQDTGSHVDALQIGQGLGSVLFFSLDGDLTDPFGYANSDSAAAQGVSPADILVSNSGAISVYANAGSLGLDPQFDDLDALILLENGVPGCQLPKLPYSWEGGEDMVLFSLRRGSATVGQTDSLQGIPIEPGDILMPPVEGGNGNPGVLVAAEVLGLRTERESGGDADDLTAASITDDDEDFIDCNGNGRPDSVDIMIGGSRDDNSNLIPDECEDPGDIVCDCGPGKGPCGNDGSGGSGCANSTGAGALLEGRGSSSRYMDDLTFEVTQLPAAAPGILFYSLGSGPNAVLGDGLTCAVGVKYRFPAVQVASSLGVVNTPAGLGDYIQANMPAGAQLILGASYYFQFWYRDPQGPCGSNSSVSNMIRLVVTQ